MCVLQLSPRLCRLRPGVVDSSHATLLYHFIYSVFVYTHLSSPPLLPSHPHKTPPSLPRPTQLRRIDLCNRLRQVLVVGGCIEEPSLCLQAVVMCYGLLAPLLQRDIATPPIAEVRETSLMKSSLSTPPSLPHSLTLSLPTSLPLTLTPSYPHFLPHPLFPSLIHSHSPSLPPSLPPSLTHSFTRIPTSLPLTLTSSLIPCFPPSFTPTLPPSLPHSPSPPLTDSGSLPLCSVRDARPSFLSLEPHYSVCPPSHHRHSGLPSLQGKQQQYNINNNNNNKNAL